MLAKSNSWWSHILHCSATNQCIIKGQRVLQSEQRTLDRHQVNQLVQEYCNIDLPQDWWAGAVAIDQFLPSVIYTANEMLAPTYTSQPQWKAWIVNTQSSTESGRHWFTVAMAMLQAPHHDKLQSSSATQRRSCASMLDAQDDQVAAIQKWAAMNMQKPDVLKWRDSWRQFEALDDTCTRKQYRDFCRQHNITQRKEAEKSHQTDSKAYKNALRQSLIEDANLKRATIECFFDSPARK